MALYKEAGGGLPTLTPDEEQMSPLARAEIEAKEEMDLLLALGVGRGRIPRNRYRRCVTGV